MPMGADQIFWKSVRSDFMTHNLSYRTHEASDQSWAWHIFLKISILNHWLICEYNECLSKWVYFRKFLTEFLYFPISENFRIFGKLASLLGQLYILQTTCIDRVPAVSDHVPGLSLVVFNREVWLDFACSSKLLRRLMECLRNWFILCFFTEFVSSQCVHVLCYIVANKHVIFSFFKAFFVVVHL